MPFEKGKSGNAKGRKRGTPNKTTATAREIFNGILFDEMDYIRAALAKVRQKDSYKYLDLMSKLLAYYFPKAQTVDLNVDFNQLTDEQADILINKLFKNQKDE